MEKEQPNFYGILPGDIRYDRGLTPIEKLLYVEIVALCNAKGYCWASNQYFADLFEYKSPTHISKLLNNLKDRGHISIKVDKEQGNKRYIYIVNPLMKNHKTSSEISEHNKDKEINLMSETEKKQIQELHRGFVILYKVDRDKYQWLSGPDKAQMVDDTIKRSYRLTAKRMKIALPRLRDAGFDMCKLAIINAAKEEWTHGKGFGDRKWELDLYEYLFRNYENVEKFANRKGHDG